MEGRKNKGRLLTRVFFRYLTVERSVILLDIDFDVENQDDFVRTVWNHSYNFLILDKEEKRKKYKSMSSH